MHGSVNRMAASATLHCLTGCAIGEVSGLVLGQAFGWSNAWTIGVSILLAFLFGYSLSALPLLRAHVSLRTVLGVVLAADTLSIFVMELFDNAVMTVVPGAMGAGLTNPLFWVSMILSLFMAFIAAFPVNRFLLQRGKGHALMHQYRTSNAHGRRSH